MIVNILAVEWDMVRDMLEMPQVDTKTAFAKGLE